MLPQKAHSSDMRAADLLKSVRNGFSGPGRAGTPISYGRLRAELGRRVSELESGAPAGGVEAVERCYGLVGPPERQVDVCRTLTSRPPVCRRRLQSLISQTVDLLDGRLLNDPLEFSKSDESSAWPGLAALEEWLAGEGNQSALADALDEVARSNTSVVTNTRSRNLIEGLKLLRDDAEVATDNASPRNTDDDSGTKERRPVQMAMARRRWRLRRMAWHALVAARPEFRVIRPRTRPASRTAHFANVGRHPQSANDLFERLDRSERTYASDHQAALAERATIRAILNRTDAAPWLKVEHRQIVRARTAALEFTALCHLAAEPRLLDAKFKRLIRTTTSASAAEQRVGAGLDFATNLTMRGRPDRALAVLDFVETEIGVASHDRQEVFRRYLAIRRSTAYVVIAAVSGSSESAQRAVDVLRPLRHELEESSLPPATMLDLHRSLATATAAQAFMGDRIERPSARHLDIALNVLATGTSEVARANGSPSDPDWYTKANLVTSGYRPGVRHLLVEADIRNAVGDVAVLREVVRAAVAEWNRDPVVFEFWVALNDLQTRLASQLGWTPLFLLPPSLNPEDVAPAGVRRRGDAEQSARVELAMLTGLMEKVHS